MLDLQFAMNTIVFIGRSHHKGINTQRGSIVSERAIVARKAWATKAITGTKVLAPYPAVLAHSFEYLVFIGCMSSIRYISYERSENDVYARFD